jgi:chromate reductase, NAD(P)H dehydrogenase (quinone)
VRGSLSLAIMSATPRILAFSGSARRESLNRKLLSVAVQATRTAGADVTLLDLNDYPLPLYHGDLEDKEGLPASAAKLIDLITQHHGLLIASPEYNSMFTPLLKNTLDWCTRGDDNPFVGKVAAVVSASPGQFGGVRSMQHLRHLLLHLGCHIVPAQCTLPKADQAFNEAGQLKDPRSQKSVDAVASGLFQLTQKLG